MVAQLIVLIIAIVLAAIIVNACLRLFMKIIGADSMFFSVKGKLIAIGIVAVIIFGLIGMMFGWGKS